LNNKIVSTKSISAIFLGIVLVAGTITAIFPFIKTAQAQPYYEYNNYGPPEYSSYKPDYKLNYPSYDKKDDKRDKSKDSSKGVSINKLKCINTNLNINGNNAGNVSIGNKGQGYLGANSYGGYYDGYGNNKQGKGFDCTINNNNTNTNIGDGGNQTITPVPPEQRATLNVTKLVTCQQADSSGLVPSIQQISLGCDDLLALITEDQFNITVTDTNVSPSNFNGSETGTLVTLDAGPFTVTEEPYDSVADDVETLEDIQTNVTGPFPSFSGDCTQFGIGSFSATGNIAAGEFQTCNIENHFNITRTLSLGSSSITTQGTADSHELTASEKITKLKKQWLDLLP
jgi:hypothetical protein